MAQRAPRLLLRQPEAQDLDALFSLHADPAANRFNPAGPMTQRDSAETLLQDWLTHWHSEGFGYWTVLSRQQPGQVLGFGGVMRKPIDGQWALNLHFRFRPQVWGQGYAAEMARAALALAFGELQESEVLSVVRPANVPARRTLERVGLRLIGSWGDEPGQPASLIYEMNAGSYAVLAGMDDARLLPVSMA